MGVSILPKFAAMVCHVRTGMTSRSAWASLKKEIARGTKMIRDTSLVMTMDVKKQAKIKKRPIWRVEVWPRKKKRSPLVNSPPFRSPATIAMRQKRRANKDPFTLCTIDSTFHGTKQVVTRANTQAAVRSAFFFRYEQIDNRKTPWI